MLLKSRAFQAIPLRSSHIAQLVQIQLFKRSPVNLRRLARVELSHNPMALRVFLSAASVDESFRKAILERFATPSST